MNQLKHFKNERLKAFRKHRKLFAEWQAALKEHSDWLHADPVRWEARCLNTLAGADLAKHKELEAKSLNLQFATGGAQAQWRDANAKVCELEVAK